MEKMTPRYKVYLDNKLLNDEPIGLLDARLNIVRDEDLKGIFFQYTSELSFYGDGYEILHDARTSGDGCAQVACVIKIECAPGDGYQDFFEGTIPIGSEDVEWDNYYYIVTTKIENKDFSNFLKAYGDYKVRITPLSDELCLDNTTPLMAITEYSTDFFNGFDGIYDEPARKTYLLSDALQQILSFLSNNDITLNMDGLYSTLFRPQQLEVTWPPYITGDILELTFTNYYNQEYTVSYQITGGSDVAFFNIRLLHQLIPNPSGTTTDRNNYLEKASNVEDNPFPGIQSRITNYLPWKSYNIVNTTTALPGLINESQAFQYGLKNLGITSKTLLQEQDSYMYVSLNDIMRHITQMSNMGYRMVKSGTGYSFNVRTVDSLISNNEAIQLDKVPNITFKASGQYALTSLTSPSGAADGIFKKISYSTGYCYGEMYSVDGHNFSTQQFFDVFNADPVQDDELMFFFYVDGDYSKAEKFETSMGEVISSSSASKAIRYHYNLQYHHALVATRYFINAGQKDYYTSIQKSPSDNVFTTCNICPQATLSNTSTVNLQGLYTFDFPISVSQARDLINNSLNYVNFKNGSFQRRGFIQEVEIPFRDLIATFDLYGEL